MGSYAVECREVTFTYWARDRPALEGINLRIEHGEFVVLLGPTGAGKSTLLMLLNGLIPHLLPGKLEGQVLVDGQDTRTVRVSELATRVGLIFEDPDTQIVSLTVEDDVAFGPSNLGLPPEEVSRRTREALGQCRLSGFEARNPFTLSGGEKQSLTIAGVLAMRPRILALDEPTSMLDPLGRAGVVTILKSLAQETGTTIVLAEQNPEIILDLADRVLVLDHGRIVLDGAPADVLRETERLTAVGVKLPPMVELFHELHHRGCFLDRVPMSVDEAAGILAPALKGRTPRIARAMIKPSAISGSGPAVHLSRVHHHYDGAVEALAGVDLSIDPGDMVAIVGQNGSGKTTLAYHMVGIRRPTNPEARVMVQGLDVQRISLRRLVQYINYVFQNPDDQLCQESVALEVGYGPARMGLSKADCSERVEKALALFGLEAVRDESPKMLDRGLRTKTALAAIVAMDPEVLIVDEPTTGLDRRDALTIFDLLLRLNHEGKTVIFISHEMDLVARYARRIVVMHQGQVLLDGTPSVVFAAEERLQEASLLPPETHRLCKRLGWPVWDGLRTAGDLAEALAASMEA